MKIELLLNRASFEHAVKKGDIAFNGWFHGPASNDKDLDMGAIPLIDLREETWGGLFVYGPTAQIFTVDKEAFSLLNLIKAGKSLKDLSPKEHKLKSEDIASFEVILKKHEIKLY